MKETRRTSQDYDFDSLPEERAGLISSTHSPSLGNGLSRTLIIIHCMVIAFYAAVFFFVCKRSAGQNCEAFAFTKFRSVLTWNPAPCQYCQFVNYTVATETIYAGNRFPDTGRAWSDLIDGIDLCVSGSILTAHKLNSVPSPNGASLAWPEAMHQLHCDKRIQEWVNREQYLPEPAGADEQHCLMHIRKSLRF